MGRMAHRVLGSAALAAGLALIPLIGNATAIARHDRVELAPAWPAFRAALADGAAPSAERRTGEPAVELFMLALAGSLVVAFGSATSGERRRIRVPARVRRR